MIDEVVRLERAAYRQRYPTDCTLSKVECVNSRHTVALEARGGARA